MEEILVKKINFINKNLFYIIKCEELGFSLSCLIKKKISNIVLEPHYLKTNDIVAVFIMYEIVFSVLSNNVIVINQTLLTNLQDEVITTAMTLTTGRKIMSFIDKYSNIVSSKECKITKELIEEIFILEEK